MLLELHIRDFALIDRLHIDFVPGFNVLTGETGAGKSIVIDALQTALGGRARADLVRSGQQSATVEAVFHLPPDSPALALLESMGVLDPAEPGTLVLRREVLVTGRSRGWINGHPVTVSQLAAVGAELVDIHGQHENQSLMVPLKQLELLDAYGGPALVQLARDFAGQWQRLQAARQELAEILASERERARRIDLLQFQVDEIDQARLVPGEEEELERLRRRLGQLERLRAETARVYRLLHEGAEDVPAAADTLADSAQALQAFADVEPDLAEAARLLETALVHVQEAAALVRGSAEGLDVDPARLEEVEERLALIGSLKRKYGATTAEVLAFGDQLRAELDALLKSEERGSLLQRELQSLEEEAGRLAGRLSAARADAARRLEEAVQAELAGLHMGPGRFLVHLEQALDPEGLPVDGRRLAATAHGVDRVGFYLAANPGEEPRPLGRVASGGELSRVALAVKRVLASVDAVPVLVFDEIDAGIGGQTAQAVAQRLRAVAEERQVICVTHLAQIATVANHHLHIHKAVAGDRTTVHVEPLAGHRRVEEIARMLAGVLTDRTVENARELLRMAQKSSAAS